MIKPNFTKVIKYIDEIFEEQNSDPFIPPTSGEVLSAIKMLAEALKERDEPLEQTAGFSVLGMNKEDIEVELYIGNSVCSVYLSKEMWQEIANIAGWHTESD